VPLALSMMVQLEDIDLNEWNRRTVCFFSVGLCTYVSTFVSVSVELSPG
jgi:hypothetical protein